MIIPEKLEKIAEYKPLSGNYLRLDANESPFDSVLSPSQLDNALSEVLLNRYPDPTAEELCNAYADHTGLEPMNIVAGNGSDELISVIVNGFFGKGDRITICPPDFPMYQFYAELAELQVDVFNKENLILNLEDLEEHMRKSGSRAVIFSNPCNPTGQGLSSSDILSFADRTGFFVIADEAYMDFQNDSIANKAVKRDNIIVLKTMSKLYGLAALRVGFAIGNEKLISAIRKAKSPYNVNSFSMALAAYTIRNCTGQIEERRSYIIRTRDELYKKLKTLFEAKGAKVYKTVANFNLVEYDKAEDVYNALLKKRIAVRRLGNLLRITVGTTEDNETLIEALGEVL
ncbi:MAG: histidinol-phosphate transaminase [Eubacteriales bacterium]|nr:histidinol-phosphate transaminase [Eubacteriales bacterium]MDD4474580.1 histidinol-phosphate transaminase [Eubacteriales bacterium]